ncbi:hypothetical protein A5647_07190 [Mycobacterium sp. 1100029.7]|nr:hypothetical protein A5647_07190 [Mycobacterium sp. 1100029.7]
MPDFGQGHSLPSAIVWVRAAVRYATGRSVQLVWETPGRSALVRISKAFVDPDDTGAVVEDELASRHDGVTTQSMNCHTAATRVISNNTVAIACATR